MINEITSTHDMAEEEWDGENEPSEVDTDMVATESSEGKGIEFHVSMRGYTMADMEGLIIEAAAKQIVGRRNDRDMARAIEAKCIEQITTKTDVALDRVTTDIIDQPVTPKYGDKNPVTMRELIGLTGREYLTERVDGSGRPYMQGTPRIERIVTQYMERHFKNEIEKATSAAIKEIRSAVKQRHEEMLTQEKAKMAEALKKLTSAEGK